MSSRAAEVDEWDLHKETIIQIYVTKGRSLRNLISEMEECYQFRRTKQQYERIFKEWGIKKYDTANDWRYIDFCLKEREAQGRSRSSVQIRGKLVSEASVFSKRKRHNFRTTLEQIQERDSQHRIQSRPKTPPGIIVCTPPGSPRTLVVDLTSPSRGLDVISPTTYWSTRLYHCADQTPWCHFMRVIQNSNAKDTLNFSYSPDCSSHDQVSLPSKLVYENLGDEPRTVAQVSHSITHDWIYSIMCATYLDTGHKFPLAWTHPELFLPPMSRMSSSINMTEVLSGSLLELFKLASYLMSNNFDTNGVVDAIVELAEDSRVFSLLKSLMDQKVLVIDAAAETLFMGALQRRKLPLVKLLLSKGVDIANSKGTRTTPLQHAVIGGYEEVVTYLLEHGANPNERCYKEIPGHKGGLRCTSILDLAVAYGNVTIIKDIMRYRPQFNYCSPKATEETLCIAVIQGEREILQFLVNKHPDLLNQARKQPWILLESAARIGSLHMIDTLLDHGLDLNTCDKVGRGSALAAASESGHRNLAEELLKRGANVNGTGYSHFRYLEGNTSLHGALHNNDKDMVQLLLDHGAQVNHPGHFNLPPIIICIVFCDVNMLDMLLNKGADVNYVAQPSNSTPIMWALQKGNSEIFEKLTQMGAKLTPRSRQKGLCDPFFRAVLGRNLELLRRVASDLKGHCFMSAINLKGCIERFGCSVAKELIDLHVVDPRSLEDANVLESAITAKDRSFVEMLLFGLRSKTGEVPTQYGVKGLIQATRVGDIDMVRLFLAEGFNPFYLLDKKFDGMIKKESAFSYAIQNRAWTIVNLFRISFEATADDGQREVRDCAMFWACGDAILKGRLDLFKMMEDTWKKSVTQSQYIWERGSGWLRGHYSALTLALQHGHLHIAKYMLDAGVVPTDPDIEFGSTPLQLAARDSRHALVNRLLDLGVDVNARPDFHNGKTALQYAASNGNFEILKTLLEAGADVNANPGGWGGRTAIEGAAECGRLDMTRFLLEAGADIKGKTNKIYRRTVYRGWDEGHWILVRMIQAWKKDKYGNQDCEAIETIMKSMTRSELDFANSASKKKYLEMYPKHEHYYH